MNANWKSISIVDREGVVFNGVFETIYNGNKIRCVVSIAPSLVEMNRKRMLFSRIFFETKTISDGVFHDISDDVYELAIRHSKNSEIISKTYFCEYYLVDKIPDVPIYSFGDYTYIE